jgi:hypothetical protein
MPGANARNLTAPPGKTDPPGAETTHPGHTEMDTITLITAAAGTALLATLAHIGWQLARDTHHGLPNTNDKGH